MSDEQKAFEQWIEINKLQRGDKVLVVDGGEGWRASFSLDPVARDFIGQSVTVIGILREPLRLVHNSNPYYAISVQADSGDWHDLPFWCLVKVEDEND